MTYADFNIAIFFIYLVGCFTAIGLSLRHSQDNRILPQTYGLWIAAAFSAHHFLVPHAAQNWHYWWYIWNAGVMGFTIIPAYMLKDAGARKPVMGFGIAAVSICLVYALFSAIGQPLPGILYFYSETAFQSTQVLSMIIGSGPVIPFFRRCWTLVSKRSWPWTQHRVRA